MDISLSEITNLTPLIFRKGEVIEKTNENLPGREGVNGKAAEPPRDWIEDIISLGAEMPDGQADVLSGRVPSPEADFFPPAAGEAGSDAPAIPLPEDAYTPGHPAGHGGTLPVLEGMYTPAGKKILSRQESAASPRAVLTGENAKLASGSVSTTELGKSIYRNALSAYAALAGSKSPSAPQSPVTVILPSTGNIPAPAEAPLPVAPPSKEAPDNTAAFSDGGGFETALPFSAGESFEEAVPLPSGAPSEETVVPEANAENAPQLPSKTSEGAPQPALRASDSTVQLPNEPLESTAAPLSNAAQENAVPLANRVLYKQQPPVAEAFSPVISEAVPFEINDTAFPVQGAALPAEAQPYAPADAALQQPQVTGGAASPQLFAGRSVEGDPLLSALLMDDPAAFGWVESDAQAQPPAPGMAQTLFTGVKHAPAQSLGFVPPAQVDAALAQAQPSEILLRNIKLNSGGAFLSAVLRDPTAFAPEVVREVMREQTKKQTKELPYSLYLFGGPAPNGLIIEDEEYEEEPESAPGVPEPDRLRVGDAIKMACIVHNLYWGERAAFLEGTPWYQVYVDYALMHHIILEGEYEEPVEFVTRAEMAAIFSRAVPKSELAPKNNLPVPVDLPAGRTGDAVTLLLRAGILAKRIAGAVFDPDGYVSRTEASVIMGRIVNPAFRK